MTEGLPVSSVYLLCFQCMLQPAYQMERIQDRPHHPVRYRLLFQLQLSLWDQNIIIIYYYY